MRRSRIVMACALCAAAWGCDSDAYDFSAGDPARGPADMVGAPAQPADRVLASGADQVPAARPGAEAPEGALVPDCGPECASYCAAADLQNPVNRGICPSTWGAGLETRPIVNSEACRRLWADTVGYFPTRNEVARDCVQRPWREVVDDLMGRDEFVRLNQRRWADRLRYDTEAVSIERVFDADKLVGKLYRGEIAYDQFAAVISAHPVLTRRHDTPGDRVGELFELFVGRPPLGNERGDLARLYELWSNGYYDHPRLGMRLPDSFVRYRCVDDDGSAQPALAGPCTSVLYGYNELVLEPDFRAEERDDALFMWSGLLKDTEWAALQMPGQLIAARPEFWERAADDVIDTYLGYDLGRLVPGVRDELVAALLAAEGDIRAAHYAVLTSHAYLQSAAGATATEHRWTWGPSKQADVEVWIDSLARMSDRALPGGCDWRVTRPGDLLEQGNPVAYGLVANSRWELNEEGEVIGDYRRLARTLGGCPANDVGGRFRTVSILNTATQLNFVGQVCDPAQQGGGAPIGALLPEEIGPDRAVDTEVAAVIAGHQIRRFFGRDPSAAELDDARRFGEACERQICSARDFARPSCFALLSSAEMLFY